MLVEFSVENYRSIKERQTFSMVASTDKTLLESNSFPMPNHKKMRLLTSAAIYRPNASGKSNLVQALEENLLATCGFVAAIKNRKSIF